ncbi:hypothetical protein MPH47_06235 [Psychrobacillus psychrodurans]|uniref:hypothetical protein n=1 Tax=Psychrobacillus psychrodurans TaxID=126157 RepID=UPI001F4D4A3E|nr:hypothetical protein [Psychrobacillus psychrodurans]MCK1996829.1 hypothetical protein [Psychrobacillus psychrodurans]
MSNSRNLLICQMERAIELLKDEKVKVYTRDFSELDNKLHEIRRDSIRFIKESHPWKKQK